MAKMRFEDDDLFAKPFKTVILEDKTEFHYLNGTAVEHNAFHKLVADEDTRVQGFNRAVYSLRCDEEGNLWYRGNCDQTAFMAQCDHNKCRERGMHILGFSSSEKKSFEERVEEEAKKSKTVKENSKS